MNKINILKVSNTIVIILYDFFVDNINVFVYFSLYLLFTVKVF